MLKAELFCNKTLSCVILRQIAYNAIEVKTKKLCNFFTFFGQKHAIFRLNFTQVMRIEARIGKYYKLLVVNTS